ncbi:MAG: NAD(P)/FAD-dependent oxidoreductase [Bacteroidota bacterium]|jgi:kynurenine 3-monooxygenase|nr:NAD(P)/FAD-dependent oxidoreductase [Bacteroidota bacterium]
MTEHPPRTILVGAGLAGSLLAVSLARRGFAVDIFERRADMRQHTISAGRSINLALSVRGTHALDEIGLLDEIMELAIPMRGRMIHGIDGRLSFQPYGKNESEVIYSVSRGALNRRLMTLAEQQSGVHIHFHQRCDGMDFGARSVRFTDEESGRTYTREGVTVIATDGAGSAIRQSMVQVGHSHGTQDMLAHGYKELTIPPTADGHFRLEKNALHIWPRRSFMLIALPNRDGSFTCTLFLPHDGQPGFAQLDTAARVQAFFRKEFPDVFAQLPDLAEEFLGNPTGQLGTVRTYPWHVGDTAALLGDAAHAIVPFFGQGMNCAFEDCTVLTECLDEYGHDWGHVFHAWQERRKANADAIADLALENFVEMRDRVADPHFQFMKKVGLELEQRFPTHFIPAYSMVTFHRTPYAVALQRGRIQQEILELLCADAVAMVEIDFARAEALITDRLRPFAEEAGTGI